MAQKISARLLRIIDALPLRAGMRVLEIGCGPGAAAREIADRFETIYVLGIDRSIKAINQANDNSSTQIANRNLDFRLAGIEAFELEKDDDLFDLAFAVRVGALDGRHPEAESAALKQIRKALKTNGRLFIDAEDSVIKRLL